MSLIDENRRGSGRQPLLNTNRVWHSDRHIVKPGIAGKTDLLFLAAIFSIGHHAVASHRTAKQFDGGILIDRGKTRHPSGLRDFRNDATVQAIRRLSYPPAEFQPCSLEKFEQLRNRIGSILGMQQSIRKSRFMPKVRGL